MKLESSKSRLNNQKKKQIKGKSAKFASVFIRNKANFKNIKIGVSSFQTGKYEILPAWRSKNQTQFKPNTNPIPEKSKMNLTNAITMTYKKFPRLPAKKQSQYKPKTNPTGAKRKS